MARDIGTAALHGRDDLLALAARRVAGVRAGTGHLLLLTGEAGIGKTRLLQAVQKLASAEGFRLWAAGAFPQDVQLSAGLLLDLGHTMSRSHRADVAARGQALVADLAEVADAQTDGGDAHRRRRLLVLDAADRLAALTDDGPALLALEDLHWCDELSLEVIAHVARRLPALPLLVVATLRTDELHQNAPARSWRSRMLLQRMAEEARLARLDIDQMRHMVRELLPGRVVSRRLVELVHQRSGGVPLHVEELVNAAAQGRLSADPSYVPETLAEAIHHRFAVLTPAAQDTALAAAVIRRTFDLDLLTAVQGCLPQEVAASLDELVERHFVHEEAPGWFGFRHALIRDAIGGNAPLARRRALHARVAEVARHRPDLGGDAYRSAHHEAAGQLDDASDAAAAAAERAAALSSHQEALDLLHRAVRCLRTGDDRRRADLLARRAVEACATDHNAQAAQDYALARDLLLECGDLVAAAALLPGLVAARHLLGDPLPTRITLLEQGLAEIERAADGTGRQRVRAALLAARAAAYLVDDRLDDAIGAGEQALAASGAEDEPTRLNTAATLGSVLMFAGRMNEGWRRLEQATRRARELGLEAEAARGYRMIGSSASTLVEYDRAERWLCEGIEYADRTEQWNHRHYMAIHQAHVWWCQGRWDEADRAVQQALIEDDGGITTRITALHVAGFVALGRGNFDAAGRTLAEARRAGDAMGELQRFAPALWGLAECALLRHDHGEAVTLTAAGYAASHAVADAANLFPFLVTGTRARLAQQDLAGAQEWADKVGADLRARGIPGTLPAVDHAAGLIRLAAGRTGQARDLLRAAYAAWSARRRWWEAQWCALDLARCAVASNRRTEASTLVEEVRAAAAAVAATPLLEASDAIAARLDKHDAAQAWSPLTLREFEVARLVARGRTNREIAEELHITARTAGAHLEHIRAKLGASRRSEIAAWVTSIDGSGATG
ncbi:MAG TPA: AAA family ATPase [Micromonosporaceae bacterium]|nr:AAA family ATPase [Micromonosporaceae bacterium]